MLGGLLDEDEREYLSDKKFSNERFFTPIQDAENNWIIPLHQILKNKNIDCWWVKYLPIVKYKPKKMDKSVIPDVMALSGLFLFTGAEVSIEGTIFEIISKFGVVAVLWFWLRDMKEQMGNQLKSFTNETELLRTEHKNTLSEFQDVHKEHKELLKSQLESKDQIIKGLQDKIKD